MKSKLQVNSAKNVSELSSISHKKASNNFWYVVLAIIFAIGMFLLWQVIAGVVLAIYAQATGHDIESYLKNITDNTYGSFVFSAVAYGGMLLSILVGLKLFKLTKKAIGLSGKFNLSNLGWVVVVFICYYAVLAAAMWFVSLYVPAIDLEQKQEIGFSTTSKTPVELVVIFASLVIFPALVEEIMMRGFLYSAIKSRLGMYMAAALVSVIFGLAHLQLGSGSTPLYSAAIDTTILSLFLIYLREKTGSLWAGILLHGIKNSLAFLFLFVITT